MSPEVFEIPARFSDKVDVFSLGCVVIFTLTHQWPEPGPAKKTVGGKLVGLSEHERREHYLVLYSERERVLYLPLTVSCLQEDPSNRPSSAALAEDMLRITEEIRKGSAGESVSGSMRSRMSFALFDQNFVSHNHTTFLLISHYSHAYSPCKGFHFRHHMTLPERERGKAGLIHQRIQATAIAEAQLNHRL